MHGGRRAAVITGCEMQAGREGGDGAEQVQKQHCHTRDHLQSMGPLISGGDKPLQPEFLGHSAH
ncbi:hypothetical protein D623_10021631 [Myotis brandtii]|uniref:Uncharacterized protein n=1 Tax=Myotis brandtii TaxID=109478 RepID=S7NU23_MYOBR|nr:hypothetical protein D623_10021631 [Myotis brandtii]